VRSVAAATRTKPWWYTEVKGGVGMGLLRAGRRGRA
jgi:hypothetical protein